MIKKGIILLGGKGSRLFPVTKNLNKHLLPIYNKPMFYYPLSVLMLGGIRDFLFIVNENQEQYFKNSLGNLSDLGIKVSFEIQKKPSGIPEGLILAKKFIKNEKVALILGDNFFYGSLFSALLKKSFKTKNIKCGIYLYPTRNISSFASAEFKKKKIYKIIEKPKFSKSNLAVSGLYIFDSRSSFYATKLKPSKRSELEIVDLINIYRKKNDLTFFQLGRGSAWLDMGTFNDMSEASNFVKTLENRQNYKIACPEEIAYKNKWITKKNITKRIQFFKGSEYAEYLKKL